MSQLRRASRVLRENLLPLMYAESQNKPPGRAGIIAQHLQSRDFTDYTQANKTLSAALGLHPCIDGFSTNSLRSDDHGNIKSREFFLKLSHAVIMSPGYRKISKNLLQILCDPDNQANKIILNGFLIEPGNFELVKWLAENEALLANMQQCATRTPRAVKNSARPEASTAANWQRLFKPESKQPKDEGIGDSLDNLLRIDYV